MVIRRYILLLLVALLSGIGLQAQGGGANVWQLSGMILNEKTGEPIPYASIRINHSRRATLCSPEGFYSIPVILSDTVHISCLGYNPTAITVKKYLSIYKGDKESNYIYMISYLSEDSIVLPTVNIFPYNTSGELRTALIETKVPEGVESLNARQNLDPRVMDILIQSMDIDKGERINVAQQLYYNQLQQKNVMPTMTLFDPVAVYQLLKYISDKAKTKKQRNLDYWED